MSIKITNLSVPFATIPKSQAMRYGVDIRIGIWRFRLGLFLLFNYYPPTRKVDSIRTFLKMRLKG